MLNDLRELCNRVGGRPNGERLAPLGSRNSVFESKTTPVPSCLAQFASCRLISAFLRPVSPPVGDMIMIFPSAVRSIRSFRLRAQNSKNWSSVRFEISTGSFQISTVGLFWATGHMVRLYQHEPQTLCRTHAGRYNACSASFIQWERRQLRLESAVVIPSVNRNKWLKTLGTLCAASVAFGASSVAYGQQDVAGAPPVFATPRNQPPKQQKLPEDAGKIRVQSPLVTTPVTALDASGEFVYDLNEDDFQVFDNGAPQRIERFEIASDPVAAVIVIQTNDAVAPLLDQVRPLGSVFSTLLLGERGQAAVILFDDNVREVQDFSNSSDQLSKTLRGITARGDQERLNDALQRAIATLGKRPKSERRVVVAFSDGFDRGSETKTAEVVRQAANAEVTIYGLGFNPAEALLLQKPQNQPQDPLNTNVTRPLPPGTPPTPTNSENVWGTPIPGVPIMIATGQIIRSALASSLLEIYAGYTGGVFHSHWSKKALQDQLNKIASEVHSQYELAYIPDDLNQEGFHRIEIRVKRPGVKVRARSGYFNEGGS